LFSSINGAKIELDVFLID